MEVWTDDDGCMCVVLGRKMESMNRSSGTTPNGIFFRDGRILDAKKVAADVRCDAMRYDSRCDWMCVSIDPVKQDFRFDGSVYDNNLDHALDEQIDHTRTLIKEKLKMILL